MRRSIYLLAVFASTTTGISIVGCAAGNAPPDCSGLYVLNVSPTAATADHSATAPGNQVQFQGVYGAFGKAPAGCAVSNVVLKEYATWQNPDPLDISISSAIDETNGTAVCTGTTAGPITLTGSFAPNSVPPATTTTIKDRHPYLPVAGGRNAGVRLRWSHERHADSFGMTNKRSEPTQLR